MHVPVPGNQHWRNGPFRCVPTSPYPSLFYMGPSVSPACTDNSSYASFQAPLPQDQGPPSMPHLPSTFDWNPHPNSSPIVGTAPLNKDPYEQRRHSQGSQDSGYYTHGVSFSHVPDNDSDDVPLHASMHHRKDSIQSRTERRDRDVDLNTNYKTHHRGRSCKKIESCGPFKCKWEDCQYPGLFARKAVLMRHIETQHVAPRSFECPNQTCDRSFNRKDNMEEHWRRVH